MKTSTSVAVVTGGASGLGLATVRKFVERGAKVLIVDLPGSAGRQIAHEFAEAVDFCGADVTSATEMTAAFAQAEDMGEVRALVHCAGRGGAVRLVDRDGQPGSLEQFEAVVRLNVMGTFNTLRLAAASMAKNEPDADGRGVCVLTSSVAAFEGQIGQVPYATSKAGIVGMTLVAARDLAGRQIRVCTIAPGTFDTPLLARLTDEVRESLGNAVPHPSRLGRPEEFASLALHVIDNPMLNGETIRLDGAIRMPPR